MVASASALLLSVSIVSLARAPRAGANVVPGRVRRPSQPTVGATDGRTSALRALPGAGSAVGAGVAVGAAAPGPAAAGDHVVRALPGGGDRFLVQVRGHTVAVDQPVSEGGTDTGSTPTELLVAALTACVAHYANRYLGRHQLRADGLQVETCYETATRPARVGLLDVRITPPPSLPPAHRDRLLAVASHCTVHNTLTQAPQLTIRLTDEAPPSLEG